MILGGFRLFSKPDLVGALSFFSPPVFHPFCFMPFHPPHVLWGRELRHCSLRDDIGDVVFLHFLLFLPVLTGANRCGPCTVKMNVRSFLMLILHCETGAKSLGPALVHSLPYPPFSCPLSCLRSLPARGPSGQRHEGCSVAVLVEDLAGYLNIWMLGSWCVCSYL